MMITGSLSLADHDDLTMAIIICGSWDHTFLWIMIME